MRLTQLLNLGPIDMPKELRDSSYYKWLKPRAAISCPNVYLNEIWSDERMSEERAREKELGKFFDSLCIRKDLEDDSCLIDD